MKRTVTILLAGILWSTIACSQNQLAPRVNREFNSWQSKLTSTKTFLVLAQDKYVPGDTVFFSAFFLTEDGHYVAGYQILRIAIQDSKGHTVHRQLVSVNDGVGGNQLVLPRTMTEGNYLIVAYNEYMKSFSENFYFRKEIQVVTRNSIRTDGASTAPVFAAEGGHLVQGVRNRVVVVAADPDIRTLSIDTEGREVAVVNLDEFGTGSFMFTPRKGDMYFATANGNRTPLPAVEEDGCSVLIEAPFDKTSVRATIGLPGTSRWRQGEIVAALTVNGQLYYTAAFAPGRRETTTISFPNKDIPGGLALLSIIGSDGSMLAARHFYIPIPPPLRYDIKVAQSNFITNDRVTAEIIMTDAAGNPVEGVFTVTVVNEDLFDNNRSFFPADLNIPSELAGLYSARMSPGWPAAVDNYLATQPGSIHWSAVMAANEPILKAPPKFVNITGYAYFTDTNKPVPDSSLLVGYMTKNRFSFDINSRKNGGLDLGFITLDGKDEMFYYMEADGKDLEHVKIRWVHDSLMFRASPWKSTGLPDRYAGFMTNKSAIDRAFNSVVASTPAGPNTNFDSALENDLMNTGVTVNVTEYRVFVDMPDLIREIIPRLYHRKNGRRETVRVAFADPVIQPKSSPLYIIDGVFTRNTAFFLSLSPADIITVKVIFDPAELSRFQAIGKNGIVIVKTRNGNGAKNAERSVTAVDGINDVIPFRMPGERPEGTRRKPDFRSTLYWSPEVRTGKNGKANISFFITDDVGKMKIRVRGVAGGQYYEAEKTIEVTAFR